MSCAKRLCSSSKGSRRQDWSKHDRVLCHPPKIVISEWRLSTLRHVLPRFALDVFVPPSHGLARCSNGFLSAARNGQDHFFEPNRPIQTRRCSDKGVKVTLEGMLGEMTARPNVALRNFSSVSTNAHCYVALVSTAFSDRLAPRKHQSTT